MSSKGNASLGGLLRGFQELGSVLCLGWGGGGGAETNGTTQTSPQGSLLPKTMFSG